jgi:hypothetical protein
MNEREQLVLDALDAAIASLVAQRRLIGKLLESGAQKVVKTPQIVADGVCEHSHVRVVPTMGSDMPVRLCEECQTVIA